MTVSRRLRSSARAGETSGGGAEAGAWGERAWEPRWPGASRPCRDLSGYVVNSFLVCTSDSIELTG
jgi:hypothetical protein